LDKSLPIFMPLALFGFFPPPLPEHKLLNVIDVGTLEIPFKSSVRDGPSAGTQEQGQQTIRQKCRLPLRIKSSLHARTSVEKPVVPQDDPVFGQFFRKTGADSGGKKPAFQLPEGTSPSGLK
jgi:hypothetical protein